MRRRSGYVFKRRGGWWARVTYVDPTTGKRRDLQRRANTRSAAIDIRDRLLLEISATEGRTLKHERATFRELADFYVSHYVHPAEYVGEQKVSGLRSYRTTLGRLKVLRAHFGNRRLRTITYADLHDFYRSRIHTPTVRARQRTIATVNRELALLRRMLGIAQQEGWIGQNPFNLGESLISPAKEVSRETVLTHEEERRLLGACDDPRRQHLRPILLVALDCGLRFGEIISLEWRDVDLPSRTLTVRAMNCKTLRSRAVAMTQRVHHVLCELKLRSGESGQRVFGVTDNVKRAFTTARRIAGLQHVRFHDLRHTCGTRLAQEHLSLAEIGRILGHTSPVTTYRYVNLDDATARRAAEALDRRNASA